MTMSIRRTGITIPMPVLVTKTKMKQKRTHSQLLLRQQYLRVHLNMVEPGPMFNADGLVLKEERRPCRNDIRILSVQCTMIPLNLSNSSDLCIRHISLPENLLGGTHRSEFLRERQELKVQNEEDDSNPERHRCEFAA